jgi:hypothetical protein
MHDEMSDLLEQANEIQEAMGRSYAVPDEIDEADLEAGASHPSRPGVQRNEVIVVSNLDVPLV